MTARGVADVYDIKHMTLAKIEKMLHGDDAPPPPVDYAAKYGLHGMTGVEVARLVHCLSSYTEMGAMLEAWSNANAPKPEPNMFWLPEMKETSAVGDPDHIVEIFARKDFVTVKCAVRLPDRTMRLWLDEDDETRWEWVDETPTKSTHP